MFASSDEIKQIDGNFVTDQLKYVIIEHLQFCNFGLLDFHAKYFV